MRRFLLASLAAAALIAAIPSGASAATTIGSDLSPDPNSSACFGGDPCTETNTTLPGAQLTAPVDGVVVRWRVRAADTDPGGNTLRLKVIRDPTGSGAFTSLRTSETRTVPDHGGTPQTFTFPSQLPIAIGDRIALDLDAASDSTLDLAIHISQLGMTLVLWNPTLADGMTPRSPDMTFAPNGEEAMFNADIEPDCDRDGLGDETQDNNTNSCRPAGAAALKCKGTEATIVGTSGDDVRSGTPGRDVMVGLEGNDRLSGLGGKDLICGGTGKDKLKGGAGKDTLLGGKGKDTLKGGGGKDVCKGGKGNDSAAKCEVEKSI